MKKHLELFKHKFEEYQRNFHIPDRDFNPVRNRAIIEETMKESDAYHKSVGKAYDAAIGERFEAMAYYGDARLNRGTTKSIREYLGDKVYTEMVGERLLEKIRVAKTVDRLGRKFIQL